MAIFKGPILEVGIQKTLSQTHGDLLIPRTGLQVFTTSSF